MQRYCKRNKQISIGKNITLFFTEQKRLQNRCDFAQILPQELTLKIFSELDIRSLSNAAMTCKVWNDLIENSDSLWYNHCLTILAVCKRELQCDRASGHSWKVTLVRNYKKSNIKRAWLLHHDADCKTHFPGRNSRKLQDRKKRRPFILHTVSIPKCLTAKVCCYTGKFSSQFRAQQNTTKQMTEICFVWCWLREEYLLVDWKYSLFFK
ncbi:F-box only protein 48 isoform X2 [Carcharodon carcharias]|uniref:F-box only protein 48 isoform X2 n=1 Tax=Carcharodon carcharias TaxID=13397 RepID=UPI001B7F3DE6|nr:F-box only protein 48 isoform X2 [Carcharodon carcharias]